MQDFFKRLSKHSKLKRDLIECVIVEIILFLGAYLLREPPLAWAGIFFLIFMIIGFTKRIRHELY